MNDHCALPQNSSTDILIRLQLDKIRNINLISAKYVVFLLQSQMSTRGKLGVQIWALQVHLMIKNLDLNYGKDMRPLLRIIPNKASYCCMLLSTKDQP